MHLPFVGLFVARISLIERLPFFLYLDAFSFHFEASSRKQAACMAKLASKPASN